MFHESSKHIDVKYHYMIDMVAQGKPKLCKISIDDNPIVLMMTMLVHVAKFKLCSSLIDITV
jgi:hypothetical protein